MKRAIDIPTAVAGELAKEKNASTSSSRWQPVLKKMASVLVGLSYNLLGFAVLIGFWYFISLITKGELPGPKATSVVFWELISDPFYDYGPNEKGIALQLFSSL